MNNPLSKFVKTNILPKLQATVFSDRSYNMLKKIVDNISISEVQLKHAVIESTILKFESNKMPSGDSFEFCPKNVRTEIETMEKVGNVYTFKIKHRTFIVTMVCNKNLHNCNKFMAEAISRIYLWFNLVSNYAPMKCSHILNIYLYLTDLPKVLPKKGEPITAIHANSAFTTACSRVAEIHLFRKEEWFKVLIHETFHVLGLDFSEFDHTNTNKQMLSIFPVKSDVRLFETYCEMWAEIINVLYMSYFYINKNKALENPTSKTDQIIKKASKMIDIEKRFSIFQCAKILDFYGLDYSDLHERTSAAHLSRTHRYKEETNVLSYYILKSIFMFYVNDFIEWCAIHNHESLDFNKTPTLLDANLDDYCKFVREHYNKSEYKNALRNVEILFDADLFDNVNNKIELNTLRMTIYEM